MNYNLLENLCAGRFLFRHAFGRRYSAHSISAGQQVASAIRDDADKVRLGLLGVVIMIAVLVWREHAPNSVVQKP